MSDVQPVSINKEVLDRFKRDLKTLLKGSAIDTLIVISGFNPNTTINMIMALEPEEIIYLNSENGKALTAGKYLKDFLKDKFSHEMEQYFLANPLFDNIFRTLMTMKDNLDPSRTLIDVTGGNKLMTSAGSVFASRFGFRICYSDHERYDPTSNYPDNTSLFPNIVDITERFPLTASVSDINTISIFSSRKEVIIHSAMDNQKIHFEVDMEDIRSIIDSIEGFPTERDLRMLSESISSVFHLTEITESFCKRFELVISEDFSSIPFEVCGIMKNLDHIRIFDQTGYGAVNDFKDAVIMYDPEYKTAYNEAKLVEKVLGNKGLSVKCVSTQSIEKKGFVRLLFEKQILHYAGHLESGRIPVKDGSISGKFLFSAGFSPQLLFLNGCRGFSPELSQEILSAKVGMTIAPLFDIPEADYSSEISDFYKSFLDDEADSHIDFVRKMKNRSLYYRVYYG